MTTPNLSIAVTDNPLMLSQFVKAGTMVYNESDVYTVRIGDSSAVSAVNGTPVGPLGSVTITADGPLWGVAVDGAAIVVLSTGANNLNNPVAQGAAIALQLAVSGVPLVYKTTVLMSNETLNPGVDSIRFLDVSQYASLFFSGVSTAPGFGSIVAYQMAIEGVFTPFSADIFGTVNGDYAAINIPVVAPKLQLSVPIGSPSGMNLSIIGSNRPTDKPVMLGAQNGAIRHMTTTANGVAGALTLLIPDDGGSNTTNYDDGIYGTAVSNVPGRLEMVSIQRDGTTRVSGIVDMPGNLATLVPIKTSQPKQTVRWGFIPAANGVLDVQLSLWGGN